MAVVPIFVSSTFVDFNRERDLLAGPILDVLDARARPYGCSIEIVDLRWGVDTSEDDEAAAQRRVLGICLGEIERCRPMFIGLVGERYGWCPGSGAMRVAMETSPEVPNDWLGDLATESTSITALEFEYALRRGQSMDAVVFQRRLEGVAGERYVDRDTREIDRFRARISELVSSDGLISYRATVGGDGLPASDFERIAIEQLWPRVHRICRQVASSTDDDPDELAWRLKWEDLSRCFVARDAEVALAVETLGSGGGVVLFGEAGAGVTSAWAHTNEKIRLAGEVVWACAVGLTAESSSAAGVASRLLLRGGFHAGTDPMLELLIALSRYEAPVTVAIDGLDEIAAEPGRDRTELALRLRHSGNTRPFVTTHDPDVATRLVKEGFTRIDVGPLPPGVVSGVAKQLVAPRTLPSEALAALDARPRLPLWLRLVARDLATISGGELEAAQASSDPAGSLRRLVAARAEELPDSIEGLVLRLLERVKARCRATGDPKRSADAVTRIVGAIASSRHGLRPAELVRIAEEIASGHGQALVATTVQALGGALAPSGPDGAYEFASPAVTATATAWSGRYAVDVHIDIARALAAAPTGDVLRASALAWHAARGGDGRGLAAAIQDVVDAGDQDALQIVVDQLDDALQHGPQDGRDAARYALATVGAGEDNTAPLVRFLNDAYWSTFRSHHDSDTAELTTERALDLGGRSVAGRDSSVYEDALVARADHLSASERHAEAMSLVEIADDALGRKIKAAGDLDAHSRLTMARLAGVRIRVWASAGEYHKVFRHQMTLNFVNKVRSHRSELDVTVLREIVDNHLATARVMEHAGLFNLCESALVVARQYVDQCAEALEPRDLWLASRYSLLGANKMRLAVFAGGHVKESHAPLTELHAHLRAGLLAPAPSNLDAAELSVEFEHLLARTSLAVGDVRACRRHLDRSIAEARHLSTGRASDSTQRWLVVGELMQSELARILGQEREWATTLDDAFRHYHDIPQPSPHKPDVHFVLRAHLIGLLIYCRPADIKFKPWGKAVRKRLRPGVDHDLPGRFHRQRIDRFLELHQALGVDPARARRRSLRDYLLAHVYVAATTSLLQP